MDEDYLNDIVKAALGDRDASERAKLVVNVVSKSHDVAGITRMIGDYGLSQTEIDQCACIASVRGNVQSYVAMVKAGAASSSSDIEVLMRYRSDADKAALARSFMEYGMDMSAGLLELCSEHTEDSI